MKKTKRLLALAVLAAAFLVAGCSGSSSTSADDPPPPPPPPANARYIGMWRLPEVGNAAAGFDVVFNADNTFVAYEMRGTAPKFVGTYAVDAAGNGTGDWTATGNSLFGKIETRLETDTTMFFNFIELNAFANPDNVNGRVEMAYRGNKL